MGALEISREMIENAPKNTYKQIFLSTNNIPEGQEYDGCVSSGVIGTHIDATELKTQLLKFTKNSGSFFYTIKEESQNSEEFVGLMKELEDSGEWKCSIVTEPKPFNVDFPSVSHVIVMLTKNAK